MNILNRNQLHSKSGKLTSAISVLLLLCLVLLSYFEMNGSIDITIEDLEEIVLQDKNQTSHNLSNISPEKVINISYENISITFCNDNNDSTQLCLHKFVNFVKKSENELLCALYELDEKVLVETILNKSNFVNISIIVDDNYYDEEEFIVLKNTTINLQNDSLRQSRYNNYMHEKFCIRDNSSVLFGSANPSINGMYYNDNVIMEVNSEYISQEFLEEFNQLSINNFGDEKIKNNFTSTIYQIRNYSNLDDKLLGEFEILFCPQEDCEMKLVSILNSSTSSIYFATFVLTLNSVEELLLNKANTGIEIKGVVEPRLMNTRGSEINKKFTDFYDTNFEVRKDTNRKTMHHKLFIVDDEIIVFGSMNPSASGAYYNDEFLVVLNSSYYANDFLNEFERLWNTSIELGE